MIQLTRKRHYYGWIIILNPGTDAGHFRASYHEPDLFMVTGNTWFRRRMKKIIIRGARQHNLRNITVELPRDKFIVITGLSGSGKSTLAFDTIYAEGQRRYVESLSASAGSWSLLSYLRISWSLPPVPGGGDRAGPARWSAVPWASGHLCGPDRKFR